MWTELYGDINDVDLFPGILAEDHQPGSSFGETLARIVLEQFKRTRDADRFWYESYITDQSVLDFIEYMDLGKVIALTTNTDLSESNVFVTGLVICTDTNDVPGTLRECTE